MFFTNLADEIEGVLWRRESKSCQSGLVEDGAISLAPFQAESPLRWL
jgi:hypothetical protein